MQICFRYESWNSARMNIFVPICVAGDYEFMFFSPHRYVRVRDAVLVKRKPPTYHQVSSPDVLLFVVYPYAAPATYCIHQALVYVPDDLVSKCVTVYKLIITLQRREEFVH